MRGNLRGAQAQGISTKHAKNEIVSCTNREYIVCPRAVNVPRVLATCGNFASWDVEKSQQNNHWN